MFFCTPSTLFSFFFVSLSLFFFFCLPSPVLYITLSLLLSPSFPTSPISFYLLFLTFLTNTLSVAIKDSKIIFFILSVLDALTDFLLHFSSFVVGEGVAEEEGKFSFPTIIPLSPSLSFPTALSLIIKSWTKKSKNIFSQFSLFPLQSHVMKKYSYTSSQSLHINGRWRKNNL